MTSIVISCMCLSKSAQYHLGTGLQRDLEKESHFRLIIKWGLEGHPSSKVISVLVTGMR